MASNYPDPLVVRLARANRDALLAREDLQIKRMAKQWLAIEQSLQRDMLLLAQEIIDAKTAGKIITEQLIARMDRYKILNASLKQQVLAYTKDKVAKDITKEQLAYAEHGLDGAAAAIKSQFSMGVNFNLLSVDQVTDLAGLLGDGTPLNRLLKEAYPESLDGIVKAMLEGSARGLGIKQIAEDMAKRMGMGLERITLIARTEQLRAWRTATQRQYQESGVVMWHERLCARDARTCMACLMADGEKIPVDQVLDDHPRGRCTSIPIVKGAPPIVREMGQEWFERQSPTVQKEMMGPGMYDLWKKEGFDLKNLRGVSVNNVWGNSPRVLTLSEIRNTQFGKAYDVITRTSGYADAEVLSSRMRDMEGMPLNKVYSGDIVVKSTSGISELSKADQSNLSRALRLVDKKDLNKLDKIVICTDQKAFIDLQVSRGRSIEHAKKVGGFYSLKERTIYIPMVNGSINPYNLVHEIGHNVQYNSRSYHIWEELYAKDPEFDRHTDYAKTNAQEGFAESYAARIAALPRNRNTWESFLAVSDVIRGVP